MLIELLGGLRIRLDDDREGHSTVEIPNRQAGSVFAYLALHIARNHAREELIDLFWPDDDIDEGRNKLRKALTAIRDWLAQTGAEPDSLLLSGRSDVRLNRSEVTTDVSVLDESLTLAAESTDLSQRAKYLHQATSKYKGELLPGFYDECFAAERNRLSVAYESALQDLAATYEGLGELDRGLEAALRAVALNPSSEDARCAAMRLFALRGQPDSVSRQYNELERALESELREKPCDNTRILMESLLRSGCQTRTHREIASTTACRIAPDSWLAPETTLAPGAARDLRRSTNPSVLRTEPKVSGERPDRRTTIRRIAFAGFFTAPLACVLILWKLHGQAAAPAELRTTPIGEVPAIVWRESYGPNEEKVGEIVLARWPEIEREMARLRSQPAAAAHFAAPLWRIAFTLGKGKQVGDWLKKALDSGVPIRPADEALAAADVAFQLQMETEGATATIHVRGVPYGRRAHVAALRSGDPWMIAHSLRALGFAEAGGREPFFRFYREHYAESYRIFRELADDRGMALVETCFASGFPGESSSDPTRQKRDLERGRWAVKAYWRWQKIGNTWGIGFTSQRLQEIMGEIDHPSADHNLCHDALDIFAARAARETAAGKLQEAGRLVASQALVLLDQNRAGEAIQRLKQSIWEDFAMGQAKDLDAYLEEFTRSRGDEPTRRRLIQALRAVIAYERPALAPSASSHATLTRPHGVDSLESAHKEQ